MKVTPSTKTPSLKQLAEDKSNDSVSKKTIYRVDPRILEVQPGFNIRVRTPGLEEHIQVMKEAYKSGAVFFPIVVRHGTQIIIDGHCRHEAIMRAIEEGAEVRKVDVMEYEGNDEARLDFMLGSAEGRPYSTLEKGIAYKRYLAWGWTKSEICAKRSVSITHVEKAVALANANQDVQQLVAMELVTVGAALDAIREYGDGAGAFLQELVDQTGPTNDGAEDRPARKKVSRRATNAARGVTRIPPKLVERYARNVKELFYAMPEDVRGRVAMATDDDMIPVSARHLRELLELHGEAEKLRGAGTDDTGGDPRQGDLLSGNANN